MFQVENLNILEYRFYLREAFIYNCMKTEEGIKYLKNAKRLEETNPDRRSLREINNGK